MHDFLDSPKSVYWVFTTLITFILVYVRVAYEATLWIQFIPIAVAVFGALTIDRSWRGVAIVLGVTLLTYITYCLRHHGPY